MEDQRITVNHGRYGVDRRSEPRTPHHLAAIQVGHGSSSEAPWRPRPSAARRHRGRHHRLRVLTGFAGDLCRDLEQRRHGAAQRHRDRWCVRLGPARPRGTFSFTIDKPGTFTDVCKFHPAMQGTITVTKHGVGQKDNGLLARLRARSPTPHHRLWGKRRGWGHRQVPDGDTAWFTDAVGRHDGDAPRLSRAKLLRQRRCRAWLAKGTASPHVVGTSMRPP